MGSKRDSSALEDGGQESSNKRLRDQAPSKFKVPERKTDTTYGQRSMFPSLDAPTRPPDDDLECEDEGDALAYLRSVRHEADGIPHLLVAPKAGPELPPHLAGGGDEIDRSIYDNGVGDTRAYYEDGAYFAAPETESSVDSEYDFDGAENDPATDDRLLRETYFSSLISQFEALRAQLHADPPLHLVEALDQNHGTAVGSFGPNSSTFRIWNHRIRYTDPVPVQIAAMDQRNALKLLRVILGGKFIRRGYELRERTSRWIWALLARLPDRGEMDYTEMGWVRELGKRAVLMMVSIAHMAALEKEVLDDLEGEQIGEDVEEGFVDEVEVNDKDIMDDEVQAKNEDDMDEDRPQPNDTGEPAADAPVQVTMESIAEDDDGEVDMDLDEGEVSDISSASGDNQADLAAAKRRCLAKVDQTQVYQPPVPDPIQDGEGTDTGGYAASKEARAQANIRATLNMILTVAGEFYGQRDLLEFRDPFPAA
ncbi:hypothetical protein QBC47DRAFT_394201 [Echria macrotheca]|uniref:Uncharacterized protein n=1 Tax=Echria macrotheca TaxID=438768 RepID=A0AAJ0B204_9PEZI|nr:hypothetical protein QBC47DRAFT_394201 [Echria macrotheca]